MKTFKYLIIDVIGTSSVCLLSMMLQPHVGGVLSNYVPLAVVSFSVGFFFTCGKAHGVSIGVEVILLLLVILLMIGHPMSTQPSEILQLRTVVPLLPLIPIGLFFGFLGEQTGKKKGRGGERTDFDTGRN